MHWSEDLIPIEDARTLDGLFVQRTERSPDCVAYSYHDRMTGGWVDLTWRDMAWRVVRWRDALAAEGVQPGGRVAMLLRNGPDWVTFDQAAMLCGLVTVPLYTDDRADNAAYILRDADVRVLLVQDTNRWKRVADALGDRSPLTRVILFESSDAARRLAASDDMIVVAEDWLPASTMALTRRDLVDPDALATIVYTSGTTGRPKGVMLSHNNILSNAQGSLKIIDCYLEDVFLSFLPLSHALERTAGYYLPMMAGARVAFARSVTQLAEDLRVIRPTVMIAVPRVFERIYARLSDQIKKRPAPVRRLFQMAADIGWINFQYRQGRRGWHPLLLLWPFLRRKVASQVLDRLGGRIRGAVSGGAPLSQDVARLFIGLGLPLVQGYGLTETSPVISANPIQDNIPDSVGIPLDGLELRIGRDDELLVKGPSIMLGYWNNQAATADMIDHDGWLHTGDQARIEDGHLFITGRLKDILILSNGEKIPPADIEMAIAHDPLFEQVLVIGEGRSFLSALLVVNADNWEGLAREFDLDPGQEESLRDERLVKALLTRIRGTLTDFPGYAKIRQVRLQLEPWTVDNGLMTPTLKIKRKQVLERFEGDVEQMYQGS